MITEKEFLKATVKDLEHHMKIILRRIKKLEKEDETQ